MVGAVTPDAMAQLRVWRCTERVVSRFGATVAFRRDGHDGSSVFRASRALTPEQIRTLSSEMAAADAEVLSVEPIACMLPKNDAKFKEAVDNSIKRQISDGSLEKLYDKWFMQPIPPNNTTLNLPLSESTKAAWANPNNKPMEEYAKK